MAGEGKGMSWKRGMGWDFSVLSADIIRISGRT